MISSHIRPGEEARGASRVLAASKPVRRQVGRVLRHTIWLCVLLACLGGSWFAFQVALVPQPHAFTPDWHDARWIQASDVSSPSAADASPVAYFRYAMPFDVLPDRAFITVTSSQVFRLYVNGYYIGSNTMDFVRGDTPQTYMYDIDSTLLVGLNVVGLRVANADRGVPQVKASIGVMWGNQIRYYPSGPGWQATERATLAHPRVSVTDYDWAKPTFDASQWGASGLVADQPASPPLMVNPRIYEQPLPRHWLSVGPGEESYFVRRVTVPAGFENALIRIMAIGEADIYINDHLFMKWNGQANTPQINVVNYLTTNGQPAPYRNGLMLGVYDVTPYLHAGENTLAVHIIAPGASMAKAGVGLEALRSSMSLDMLVGSGDQYRNPLANDTGWHASLHPVDGWAHASDATSTWSSPQAVGRPGASSTFYMPDSSTPRNVQLLPPMLVLETVALACGLILALWLTAGLGVLRRFYASKRVALEAASLIFLPALALEALLMTLSRQSQLPQPFPYTWWGALVLVGVVVASIVLLRQQLRRRELASRAEEGLIRFPLADALPQVRRAVIVPQTRWERIKSWLAANWAIVPLVLIAIPMVCYDIGYEPYWQDELTSYAAALNIMSHGYPAFLSGVAYPKAELFSLNMAIVMSFFGTTSHIVPRLVSVVLYLTSLPILYVVGSRLFNRKVAWLATAMLLLSPYAMIWSRQARMYEQAQFMVIVVMFVMYWAIQNRHRVLPIYVATATLLLAYFSHEEVFIILPAVVVCALLGSREGRYGIPSILRNKHWWIAAGIAAAIIAIQLMLVVGTHPTLVGTDQSQRPQIQPTTNNVPYYFAQLFMPHPLKDGPTVWTPAPVFMTIHSLLAVLGCVLAFWRKDKRARYCALFLLLSAATLIFVFTMQADRYYYALWPVHFLMAAYALWWLLRSAWIFARPRLLPPLQHPERQRVLSLPVRVLTIATTALVCTAVLLLPILPLTNYNLFISRVLGTPFRRHYADYDEIGHYMQAHLKEGDVVISVSPAIITYYYTGHNDHYYSYDRALFLFEDGTDLRETTSGAHPLLNQDDVNAVLSQHGRIWIVSDAGGYQGGVTKNGRFTFPPAGFRIVYEGYGSSVYFRDAEP